MPAGKVLERWSWVSMKNFISMTVSFSFLVIEVAPDYFAASGVSGT